MASAHAAAKTSSVRSFSARTRWKVQHNLSGAFVAVNAETRGARQRSPRSRSFSRSKLVRHFFRGAVAGPVCSQAARGGPSMLTAPPFALARRSLAGGDGRSSRRCEAPMEARPVLERKRALLAVALALDDHERCHEADHLEMLLQFGCVVDLRVVVGDQREFLQRPQAARVPAGSLPSGRLRPQSGRASCE